jgi:hypothetical protein
MYDKEDIDKLIDLCKDMAGWLSVHRGLIARDYAKDLVKILSVIDNKKKGHQ